MLFDGSKIIMKREVLAMTQMIKEPFLADTIDYSTYSDVVFQINSLAKADALVNPEKTVNATIGTLCGEDGKILAFRSVYDSFRKVPDTVKASYASDLGGNPDFREEIFKWINRNNNIELPHAVIAAPGGTGALFLMFTSCMNKGETVLLPDIYWGSYNLMVNKQQLKSEKYRIAENNQVSIRDLMAKAESIMERQGKLMVIINDPCHNPTGISLGYEKWSQLIDFFNKLSEKGPVIVVNDTAYLDFAHNPDHITDYMANFNKISDNVLISLAYSCSKAFTCYGARLGANIILAKDPQRVANMDNALRRVLRGTWSNGNNGFMHCVVDVLRNHKEEYLRERDASVAMLQRRADIVVKEAEECGLPLYPYHEGFFITIPIEDSDLLSRYHAALMKDHIYTVKFQKGIRIAICGLPEKKCYSLAARMKTILEETVND